MGLNIKNPDVEQNIRELARIDGTSLTEAVGRAVDETLRRRRVDDPEYQKKVDDFLHRLKSTGPPTNGITSDHSDFYDDDGLPA